MISSLQALLARTMLGFSQKYVGAQLGMSHTNVSRIEKGEGDTPASRLLQLQRFYENEGVEFTDGNGLKERRSYLQHYHGVEEFKAFMDDVYATAKKYGGFNFLLNLEADVNYVPPHIDSLDFTVSPNPTSQTTLALAITTNFSTATSVLNIYDNLGNAVIPQVSLGALVEGTQGKSIDITGVSSGLYSVVITANGINYSESLVVN